MSCQQCKRVQSIHINPLLMIPYSLDKKSINSLLRYFQYEAPGISSTHAVAKNEQCCKRVFDEFLRNEKIDHSFCGQSAKISKHLSPRGLSGEHLCLKCNRIVCKLKNPKDGVKEEYYQCFLRHMRNSIAHGNVYCQLLKNRTNFIFDDYTVDGKRNLTARIIVSRSSLSRLMKKLKAL